MLDSRSIILLNYINEYCKNGGYKIISTQEMLSCFPEYFNVDAETLKDIIKFLKENNYVNVKYVSSQEYCLSTLTKGRRFSEEQFEKFKTELYFKKKCIKFSFLGSLIAGLVSVIINIIFMVLLC